MYGLGGLLERGCGWSGIAWEGVRCGCLRSRGIRLKPAVCRGGIRVFLRAIRAAVPLRNRSFEPPEPQRRLGVDCCRYALGKRQFMHNVEPSPFGRESAFKRREVPLTKAVRSCFRTNGLPQPGCDPATVRPLLPPAPHVRGNRVSALQLTRTFLLCQTISKFTARTIMQWSTLRRMKKTTERRASP